MGSMWLDPPEDERVYPGQQDDVKDFDEKLMTKAQHYPKKRWSADFESLIWVAEFTTLKHDTWRQAVLGAAQANAPPSLSSQDFKDGLKDLVELQKTRRTGAMAEILAQSSDFQFYFCSQLGIYPRTYPKSYLMLKGVARIGELVMVFVKQKMAGLEPRPSQIYPALTPPVAVPPHSSFPSGHAVVSHLMANMAYAIVPEFKEPAKNLAKRIRKNREIAGLHYWWDGTAGEKIAEATFMLIKDLPSYLMALNGPSGKDGAKSEWTDF